MIYELIGVPGVGKTYYLTNELKEGKYISQSNFFLRISAKALFVILSFLNFKKKVPDRKLRYKYIQYSIVRIFNLTLYADESITQYLINRLLEGKITWETARQIMGEMMNRFDTHLVFFEGKSVSDDTLFNRLQKRNTNKYSELTINELSMYRKSFDKEVSKMLNTIDDKSRYSYYSSE